MTSKNRITSQQFADLIIGKKLTTNEISALLREKYPDSVMSRSLICHRLRAMLNSPYVTIEREGENTSATYHLKSYTDRYINHAEKNYRAHANDQSAPDKSLWHFHPVELRACRLHKMFDQALASVQGASA
ncbi:conserved hypothetical protein [Enterobacterales bacterium 8AC]|nr:conserved hypothetical protein [Enterobacterales bacterium 8AC]